MSTHTSPIRHRPLTSSRPGLLHRLHCWMVARATGRDLSEVRHRQAMEALRRPRR